MQNFSPTKVAQYLIKDVVSRAHLIIDATCGAGYDCLFLAQNASSQTQITAFDIQPVAVSKTTAILQEHNLEQRVSVYLDSYINFASYIQNNIDLVIFNLGYLPGADKNVTTQVEELKIALPQMLAQLNLQGVICIVSYTGHLAGKKENLWLEEYLLTLENRVFSVGKYLLFNHENNAPVVYIIEKVKGEGGL